MKYAIVLLFTCVCLQGLAQQPIDVKARLTPNHTYENTFRGSINYKLDIKSQSPVAALKLEAAGLKVPFETAEVTTIKVLTTTGPANAKNQIPFEVTYIRSHLQKEESDSKLSDPNEDYIDILQGQRAKGTISAKGKITIDSITDTRLTETDINRFDLINVIKLYDGPNKPIKPGDTYTVKEKDVKITDIGPVAITVERVSIFKLTEIKDGKAYFDVSSKLSGSFTGGRGMGDAKGGGTGKMVFDIQNQMPIEYANNTNAIITLPLNSEVSIQLSYTSASNNTLKIN